MACAGTDFLSRVGGEIGTKGRMVTSSGTSRRRNPSGLPADSGSIAMNHCDVARKMTGLWQRQQCGYECSYGSWWNSRPRWVRSVSSASLASRKKSPPTMSSPSLKWPASSIITLDQSTNSVVERLTDPTRVEVKQTKGLVVGYVQSGKVRGLATTSPRWRMRQTSLRSSSNHSTDDAIATAMVQAYNDWHVQDWCGAHPGRFIPLGLPMIASGSYRSAAAPASLRARD